MSQYKKLEKQPLQFVLAEFRFSQVMQIAEYIPQIQEQLRRHYPITQENIEQTVSIQTDGTVVTSAIRKWTFCSAGYKSAVMLDQDRLIYLTSNYPRFEKFAATCREITETLINAVKPELLLRIGLRYGDLVKVGDGEEASELVDKDFVYAQSLSKTNEAVQKRTETYFETGVGRLVVRSLYGNHSLMCLPDIHGLPISIAQDSQVSERVIIDFDHFWEAKQEAVSFDANEVIHKLEQLHETSREAFWAVTTDYARDVKWS